MTGRRKRAPAAFAGLGEKVVVGGVPVVLKLEDNFVVERAGLRRVTLTGYGPV